MCQLMEHRNNIFRQNLKGDEVGVNVLVIFFQILHPSLVINNKGPIVQCWITTAENDYNSSTVKNLI